MSLARLILLGTRRDQKVLLSCVIQVGGKLAFTMYLSCAVE